jgi:hypothetical protein
MLLNTQYNIYILLCYGYMEFGSYIGHIALYEYCIEHQMQRTMFLVWRKIGDDAC